MRVPIEWLYDYVEPHMDAFTLAQRLALTGTEVERVEHHGVQAVDQFVVGHVLERLKHPDADRLSVCMVDIGRGTPSQIVCGAPNVGAGQTVAVARPGAIMPDGKQLQRATLRGQRSGHRTSMLASVTGPGTPGSSAHGGGFSGAPVAA